MSPRVKKPGRVTVDQAVKRELMPPKLPIDRLREMLEAGGFAVDVGDMGDESCLWLKAMPKDGVPTTLPPDGSVLKGAHSVEFCFTFDGRAITDITVAQDVWERTDSRTLLRMDPDGAKTPNG